MREKKANHSCTHSTKRQLDALHVAHQLFMLFCELADFSAKQSDVIRQLFAQGIHLAQ